MELYEALVETVASAKLPWEETLIMPIGDVQLGSQGCDEDRLKRDLDWGMKYGAYFLGMGDICDVASPSNRLALSSVRLYDSVTDALAEAALAHVDRFLELARGTEGKWLGLLSGDHYFRFDDGTTSDMRIAAALKAPFLGNCAFVRLGFQNPSHRTRVALTIWCHHGAGGGITLAAPLNRLERLFGHFDADIYLIGHQHKLVAAPTQQIYMTSKPPQRLAHRTKIIACTGGYLKGYMLHSQQEGRPGGSYVERWMKNPVTLGCIKLHIRPFWGGHKNEYRLDISVEL